MRISCEGLLLLYEVMVLGYQILDPEQIACDHHRMATSKRPKLRKQDRVSLSRIKRPTPAYGGKPFVGREDVQPLVCTGCGQPAHASETDDAGYHPRCAPSKHSTKKHLDNWLEDHGYKHSHARTRKTSHPYANSSRMRHAKRVPFSTRKCYACDSREAVGVRDRRQEGGMIEAACVRHADPTIPAYPACALCSGPIKPNSYDVDGTLIHKACHKADIHGHARIIHQAPTGRPVFAAHERDHHITTSGRRALDREQFALPPGPDEKRRGIGGRLPIDTIERARNALQRAPQMRKRGHITVGQLAEVRRMVHRAWPSIEVHTRAHATMSGGGGNFKSTERPFTEADVARLARQALARSHGNIAKAGQYASNMADRYESAKWERVMDYILKQSK
jgi:hypothetical protein